MADLAIAWDNQIGSGDLCVAGSDLVGGDDLSTAALVSLFTDRRAAPADLPAGDTDRRGHWGDQLGDDDDPIGSLLWLLERSKLTNETLALAERYSADALAWMVDDSLALDVATTATRTERDRMALRVRITLPDRSVREFEFDDFAGGR